MCVCVCVCVCVNSCLRDPLRGDRQVRACQKTARVLKRLTEPVNKICGRMYVCVCVCMGGCHRKRIRLYARTRTHIHFPHRTVSENAHSTRTRIPVPTSVVSAQSQRRCTNTQAHAHQPVSAGVSAACATLPATEPQLPGPLVRPPYCGHRKRNGTRTQAYPFPPVYSHSHKTQERTHAHSHTHTHALTCFRQCTGCLWRHCPQQRRCSRERLLVPYTGGKTRERARTCTRTHPRIPVSTSVFAQSQERTLARAHTHTRPYPLYRRPVPTLPATGPQLPGPFVRPLYWGGNKKRTRTCTRTHPRIPISPRVSARSQEHTHAHADTHA